MFNSSYVIFIKFIFNLFCICGLFYQTYEIYSDFIRGKTITKLKFEKLSEESLPAITICLPNSISMEKAALYDNHTMQLYRQFNSTYAEYDKATSTTNKTNLGNDLLLGFYIMDNYLLEHGISAGELISKYTIDWSDFAWHKNIVLFGVGQQINGTTEELPYSPRYDPRYIGTPVASIVSGGQYGMLKCFTLFSALQKEWRDYRMYLDVIGITLRFDEIKCIAPPNFVYLAVHSPLDLPDYNNDMIRFETKKQHIIQYYRLDVTMLGESFETNCKYYDLDNSLKTKTRSDCIIDCMRHSIYQMKGCVDVFEPQLFLFREERLDQDQIINKCNLTRINKQLYQQIKSECNHNCRMDCTTSFFNLNSHSLEFSSNWAIFEIRHAATPDIKMTHHPETTLISVVCNFGGLLGMWLGMSILSTSKHLFSSIDKFIHRHCNNSPITNITLNNFQQNLFVRRKQKGLK